MKIEGQVPRIESATKEEFVKNFVIPSKPVILAGATRKWKAYSEWTLDRLRSLIGEKVVRVKDSATGIYPDIFSGMQVGFSELKFSDYIDLIASNRPERSKKYLSGDDVRIVSNYSQTDSELSVLMNDIELPEYCDGAINTIGFWLSAKGVVAALHYDGDGSHNLNAQIKGQKRVLLFHPSQSLYPFSGIQNSNGGHNFSQIDITRPDEARFPAFRSARALEGVLEEGDMLFIPSYWHHALFHEGDVNINVNFWWQPNELRLNKASFHATYLTILRSALCGGDPFLDPVKVKSAIEGLSPETRRLLQGMEEQIRLQYRL
ncbi:cupin-like domain-containing protein [Granulicella sp. S190]|uniref:cupin-like domain-containing protein n=1 Tax=Granulicella sp. S190 TaxID=1747226 RepID=UPI00131B00A4|nr:cupin-like domain-containing protein [Granulicella sp. S190]